MLFASYTYVAFLAAMVVVRWTIPERGVLPLLLVASYVFYASAAPWHLALLLFVTVVGYVSGLAIERFGPRRALLVVAVAIPLALLGWFKYAGFAAAQWNAVRGAFGVGPVEAPDVALPLGVSFFTFQVVSYATDVHRGERAERDPLRFALYLAFFPHLVAGPIVRAAELVPQLRARPRWDAGRFVDGADLLARGFVKKLVFADNLGRYADAVFASPGAFGATETWLGVLAYAGQIYCDFSAYTDLARGSAKLLGYELPENFDLPYLSRSITEFWRRWHVTLSRFLRDYLYVPLGGGREGRARQARNLVVTMALGGLWHGASWTFVLWGLGHGALLFAHKAVDAAWSRAPSRVRAEVRGSGAYAALATAATFLSVAALWVLFRAPSVGVAGEVYAGMLGWGRGAISNVFPEPAAKAWVLLGALAAVHALSAVARADALYARAPLSLRGCAWAGALAACYLFAGAGETFIYFRF